MSANEFLRSTHAWLENSQYTSKRSGDAITPALKIIPVRCASCGLTIKPQAGERRAGSDAVVPRLDENQRFHALFGALLPSLCIPLDEPSACTPVHLLARLCKLYLGGGSLRENRRHKRRAFLIQETSPGLDSPADFR